jgi:hypothetical protein
MFTFNWDFFGRAFPDGSPPVGTPGELWHLWKTWKTDMKAKLQIERSTSTLERSLNSRVPDRVHIHWKVDLETAIDMTSTETFWFKGVRPDVGTTSELLPGGTGGSKQARGTTFREASNRAHFYCWVNKAGSLKSGSNWKPFRNYRVNGRWLEDLWGDGKLDDDVYMHFSMEVRRGHLGRKREMEAVRADRREARINQRILCSALVAW